jgi:hypothetical protein
LCSIEEQITQLLNNENDYQIFQLTEILRGTKSIIDFWINRFNQISVKELQMECGHSIVGKNVDYYGQYLKSDEIMAKMEERLKELLRNNEPKNIAVICDTNYEKQIIESRLESVEIAFGSTIEQDNNHSLIAVEEYDNTYSREWPFVIYVYLSLHSRQFSIISSSRAIAHLTLIERNYKEIIEIIRDNCDDDMMKTILSSSDIYKLLRNQIDLADDELIMCHDLYINIISFNYLPSQIKQLYPNIFDDCNTFDQFFDRIVNKHQWMLLLFVHQLKYLQNWRHMDKSIGLIIEYKQSRNWIESYEIEEMRAEYLINNTKNAIELINTFIQPQVQEMMDKVVTDNRQLFEVFKNSNGIHQFNLIAYSILKIITITCSQIYITGKVEINTNEIDNNITKLLQNLNCSVVYNTSAKVLQSLQLIDYKSTTTDHSMLNNRTYGNILI